MYDQSGNYIALAGVIVGVLAKFNIIVDEHSIATVLAAIVIIVGIIKQRIAHKKLAITTGTFPSKE